MKGNDGRHLALRMREWRDQSCDALPPLFGLPLVVGGGSDAAAPPDLVDGVADIGLFED